MWDLYDWPRRRRALERMARAMLVAVVALAVGAEAFSHGATMRSSTALQAYVPDGMTAAEYQALKKKETEEQKKKKFGAVSIN